MSIVIGYVLLSLVITGLWACANYMRADQRDDTINRDQFRRERAAILEQVQAEQRQRFLQRNEERGA